MGVTDEDKLLITESVGFGETVAANDEAAGDGVLLSERGAEPVSIDCVARTEADSDGVAETLAGFDLEELNE